MDERTYDRGRERAIRYEPGGPKSLIARVVEVVGGVLYPILSGWGVVAPVAARIAPANRILARPTPQRAARVVEDELVDAQMLKKLASAGLHILARAS
jgi:hypothetical protein